MPSCKPIKTFDNRLEMDYCQDSSLEIHSALSTSSPFAVRGNSLEEQYHADCN